MRVNETFISLQGEGHFAGVPAFFLRLAGCNLACPFCDTDHQAFTQMSEDEIVEEASHHKPRHIVITGGEPALQLTPSLVDKLHAAGFFIQVEPNGPLPLPQGIDWVTCSPKSPLLPSDSLLRGENRVDELKVLYHGEGTDLTPYEDIPVEDRRLQPLDTADDEQNRRILRQTIDYVLNHPGWSLSLQTHKMLGIK